MLGLLRAMLFVLAALVAAGNVALAQTEYSPRPGAWPWDVWSNPPYREHFSWTEFKERVAALNSIENSDESFKKIQKGSTLLLPTLPGEAKLIEEMGREKAALDQRIADLESAKQALEQRLASQNRGFWNMQSGWFFVALILLTAAVVTFSVRTIGVSEYIRRSDIEIARLRRENAQLHLDKLVLEGKNKLHRHFLRLYSNCAEEKVPSDIGSAFGNSTVLVLISASTIDGEEAIVVPDPSNTRSMMSIKRGNFKRYLDQNKDNPFIMSYFGIEIRKSKKVAELHRNYAGA